MTRIKVCGITDERDALEAVHLGVDALGFVLSKKSPRYIPPRDAARIGLRLPPFVARVGVFIDEPAAQVADVIYAAGLTALQFHGSESPDYCRRFELTWYKTFRLGPGFDPEELAPYPSATCLLELPGGAAKPPAGPAPGTGRRDVAAPAARVPEANDDPLWSRAAAISRSGRVILGGALDPGRVAAAIAVVRPYAVDASAGIEFVPGKPDIDKLETFVEAVRLADTRLRLFDRQD